MVQATCAASRRPCEAVGAEIQHDRERPHSRRPRGFGSPGCRFVRRFSAPTPGTPAFSANSGVAGEREEVSRNLSRISAFVPSKRRIARGGRSGDCLKVKCGDSNPATSKFRKLAGTDLHGRSRHMRVSRSLPDAPFVYFVHSYYPVP